MLVATLLLPEADGVLAQVALTRGALPPLLPRPLTVPDEDKTP